MKKLFAIALAATLMIGAAACSNTSTTSEQPATTTESTAAVKTMTGDELVALLADSEKAANTLVVDVRKADEYTAGHIAGAINIALEDIEANIAAFEAYKDKDIVLYCNSGNRSGQAADLLVSKGYTSVYNADGVKNYTYELVTDTATAAAEPATVKMMTGDELVALIADTEKVIDTLIIDVRAADEYEAGHIDPSINIPLEEIEARLSEIESYKDKTVVLYCNSGNRSGQAAEILVNNGFMDVYNAAGVKEYTYTLVTE